MASWGETRPDTAADTVLGPAWSLRWRAPELALMLAERAGAAIEPAGDGPDRLRAEATVVVASCRLGHRLEVVDRAIDAIGLAERHSDDTTSAMLRIELAGCARAAGVPLVGAAVLRPVLTATGIRPAMRADALVRLTGCLTRTVDPAVLDDALAEADRLYAEDRQLDPDNRLVLRALLRSVASGEQRRRGDARAAVDAAQEGADLLGTLNRPTADNGQAGARVALRLVHGLLDLGRIDEAGIVAATQLRQPVRAPAADAIGWLSVAMAVRTHLATGTPAPAFALLREAAELGRRHRLSSLRAEALTILSDAHERIGQLAEALDCLRTAQGVRLRRARVVYSARTSLVSAFGETTSPEEFVRMLGVPAGRRGTAGREQAAELLSRVGMRHPLTTQVGRRATPGADVTMVLVDVTAPGGADIPSAINENVLSHVLDRLRAAAPSEAQVARVGGAELVVLLPGAPQAQAEQWVADLRGAMASVDWTSFTPGLTVAVRAAVAHQPGSHAADPVPAAPQPVAPQPVPADASQREPARSSVFELPTVPIAPLSRPGRSRSERSGTESAAGQEVLARALEQWRQTKSTQPPAPATQEPRSTPQSPTTAEQPWSATQLPASAGQQPWSAAQSPAPAEQQPWSGTQPPAPTPGAQPPTYTAQQPMPAGQPPAPFSFSATQAPRQDAGPADAQPTPSQQGAFPAEHDQAARFPLSADPSIRISAADIAAAGAPTKPAPIATEPARQDAPEQPELSLWAPRLPPPEPPMAWPTAPDTAPTPSQTDTTATEDPYRSPFVGSPFTDPMGDPNEPSRPRHAVATEEGRSVLSSLGIAAGGAGTGRRRAKEDAPPDLEPEANQDTDTTPQPRTVAFDTTPQPGAVAFDDTPQPRTVAFDDTLRPRTVAFDDTPQPRMVAFDDISFPEPLSPPPLPELPDMPSLRRTPETASSDSPLPTTQPREFRAGPTEPSGYREEFTQAEHRESPRSLPEPVGPPPAASWETGSHVRSPQEATPQPAESPLPRWADAEQTGPHDQQGGAGSTQRRTGPDRTPVPTGPAWETGSWTESAHREGGFPPEPAGPAEWAADRRAGPANLPAWGVGESGSQVEPANPTPPDPAQWTTDRRVGPANPAAWESGSHAARSYAEPPGPAESARQRPEPTRRTAEPEPARPASWRAVEPQGPAHPSRTTEPTGQPAPWESAEPTTRPDQPAANPPGSWEAAAARWPGSTEQAPSRYPVPLPAQQAPISDPPPVAVPAPAAQAEVEDERTQPLREQESERKPEPRTGRRRRSVQLADLLTEALMAYQTAQDANDARNDPLGPDTSLPGPTSLPEPLAGSLGRDVATGDRPNQPGRDTRLGDSKWLTTRWDPSSDRP